MSKLFDGRNVIVTGGGRGIGRETALAFAAHGARVVVNDLGCDVDASGQDPRVAQAVVEEIQRRGGIAVGHTSSVADFQAAAEIIESCVTAYGSVDVLVNAAGIGRLGAIWRAKEEDFDSLVAVHLKGTFNMCRHACSHMKERRSGRIINVTSDFWRGLPGFYGTSMYGAVKAGIVGLTRGIAHEMAPYGTTCNAISPLADTRMLLKEIPESVTRAYRDGKLEKWFYESLGSPGGPEHIPPIVLFLASESGARTTGKVFGVSKGRVAVYAEPDESRCLNRDGLWAVEELARELPAALDS